LPERLEVGNRGRNVALCSSTKSLTAVAAAFIGASSKLMPTINEKFPPPGGTDNPIVSGSLQLCGLTIMLALLLTLYGLLRS